MSKREKKAPTSSVSRALRLGNLGFRVAGSYVGYQMQNLFLNEEKRSKNRKSFNEKNAQRVRNELESMRGPVMKLGQMLSMQTHVIPDEVISELTNLQMQAPAMHPTLMRSQFKRSMGDYPEDIFATFEQTPFAAASLGQVHHAETPKGDKVVVKIQYPAIRQAIKNDFTLLRSAGFPMRKTGYLSDDMIQEAEKGILAETDYRLEAQNLSFFRDHLKDLPYVHVPKVFAKYSSERVVTMSSIDGLFLDEWLELHPSQEDRDQLGAHLFELFLYQIFKVQAIHADPHPGNYLYGSDGTIGMVDFGCVKYFSPAMRNRCLRIHSRTWESNPEEYNLLMQDMFGPKADPKNPKHRKVMEGALTFFDFLCPRHGKTIDFSQRDLFDKMDNLWDDALKQKLAQPEVFFICRAELGLYNTLHKLGARINTTEIDEKYRD